MTRLEVFWGNAALYKSPSAGPFPFQPSLSSSSTTFKVFPSMAVYLHPTDDKQAFRPAPGHLAYPIRHTDLPYVHQPGREPPPMGVPLCAAHGMDGCPEGAGGVKMHYAPEYFGAHHHLPSPEWTHGRGPL
jgi:hypothetical protein